MTIVFTVLIILALCYILRVPMSLIITVVLILAEIAAVFMAVSFLYFFIRLLFSKKRKGRFIRIDKVPRGIFRVAFYQVGDREVPCIFPEEGVMRDLLYRRDRDYTLMLNERMGRVYDRFAISSCIIGLPFSTLMSVGFLYLLSILR